MLTYRYANELQTIIVRSDNVYIPVDEKNVDYTALLQEGVTVDAFEPVQLPPSDISDRQFFEGLRRRNIISDDEFLAAVSVGAIPQAMQDIMATQEFVDALTAIGMDLISAKGLIMGARTFEFNSPLTPLFAAAFNWTTQQTRDFWIECAGY